MDSPLVSIIVPVYNACPYLHETLDSIVRQTYGNLEVLLVDDGSEDGSGEICDAYAKDRRVRVIHQKNRGLSAARNSGLDRMSGDVVAFLDADDLFYPEMIQTLLGAMQRNDADIVVGGYDRRICGTVRGNGRKEKVFAFQHEELLTSSEALVAMVEGRLNKAVWNKLYARKLWDTIRFPDGKVYEDIFTTHQVLGKAQKIVIIPGTQMMYRIRERSITQNRSSKNLRARLDAYDHLEQFVSRHVPDLFNDNQLQRLQARQTRMLMANWGRLSLLEKASSWDIRRKLLWKNKALKHECLDARTRISCALLRFCPFMMSAFDSGYGACKKFMKTVSSQ